MHLRSFFRPIKIIFEILLLSVISLNSIAQSNPDAILGKWMTVEGNLKVEVYKENDAFKAKILWFDDSDDKAEPTNVRCDKKNPHEELRSRKIVGMEVMHGLIYNEDRDEWQHGWIYDSSSGKTWNSKAWLKDGRLKVRGFWNFEFLGQTMSFDKVP